LSCVGGLWYIGINEIVGGVEGVVYNGPVNEASCSPFVLTTSTQPPSCCRDEGSYVFTITV
jgi:hypothetical protein